MAKSRNSCTLTFYESIKIHCKITLFCQRISQNQNACSHMIMRVFIPIFVLLFIIPVWAAGSEINAAVFAESADPETPRPKAEIRPAEGVNMDEYQTLNAMLVRSGRNSVGGTTLRITRTKKRTLFGSESIRLYSSQGISCPKKTLICEYILTNFFIRSRLC